VFIVFLEVVALMGQGHAAGGTLLTDSNSINPTNPINTSGGWLTASSD